MGVVTYGEALAKGFEEVFEADDRVSLFGAYFGGQTGEQRHFDELAKRYPDRFEHPPWSELGNTGLGIGAATMGLRPVINVVTASFIFQGFGQVINEAPNIYYTTNGRTTAPVMFYMLAGIRGAGASQHSHRPQAMFWNTPGLKIALPATPGDAYGLIRDLLVDNDQPTAFITHPKLMETTQDISDWEAERLGAGHGRIEREGEDVSIIASSVMVIRAREAARELADRYGISCEVVNLRTLVPYDDAIVAASVRKTRRVVVADECHRSAGVGSEILARIAEAHFDFLKCAPKRVVTPDVPIPFSPALEAAVTPTSDKIVTAVRELCSA